MGYGRFYEEFTVGEVIKHWPGRTITETDCTWFALLTMNQHPVHSDAHYAATQTQHKQRLVLGPLVFSIGIGMTVAEVSGKAIATRTKVGSKAATEVSGAIPKAVSTAKGGTASSKPAKASCRPSPGRKKRCARINAFSAAMATSDDSDAV